MPADPNEAAEVHQLRAANKRLAQELEVLKKSHCYLQRLANFVSRYQFIDQQRTSYPARLLCQVLGVTPSRYQARGLRVTKVPELYKKYPPAWPTGIFCIVHLRILSIS